MDDVSKPKYAKTLKEHLQQQQEPFSLQNYIIERSYMLKSCNSDGSNSQGLHSTKNLKWSIKYDLHKIRTRFLHATGTLTSSLYKFSTWDEEERSGDECYVHEVIADTQATQQTDELFSLKRLAASDYFANSDVEGKVLPYQHHSSTLVNMFQTFTLPTLTRSEVDTGYRPRWISSKEIKQQHMRGSEWEEPQPNAVSHLGSPEAPVTSLRVLSQKVVRDTAFSTYLRKLLVNSNILKLGRSKKDKLHEMCGATSPCRGDRRVLQKRGQLPFECVVEKGKEFYLNEGKSHSSVKADSKSEDFGSVIHERFSLLGKQCREVRKTAHLLYTESCVTSQEWKNLQIVNRGEILMEIGDAILDGIVMEIADSF